MQIKKGNDIGLVWSLLWDDQRIIPLSDAVGLDVKVVNQSTFTVVANVGVKIRDNQIELTLLAKDIRHLGKYRLEASWKFADDNVDGGWASYSVDYQDAFEITPFGVQHKPGRRFEVSLTSILYFGYKMPGNNGDGLSEEQKQWIGEGTKLINETTSLPEGINKNTQEIDKRAPKDHTHDYAPLSHDHNLVYAPKSHTHNYAPSNHNHDLTYAPKEHTHTGFAKESHTHDYAPSNHTHNYAPIGHNHDSVYAPKTHSHADKLDAPKNGTPGQVLTKTADGHEWKTPTTGDGSTPGTGEGLTEAQKTFLGQSVDLQTESKVSLPSAINEVKEEVGQVWNELGQISNSPYSDFDIMDKVNGVSGIGVPVKSVNRYDCTNKRIVVYQYSKYGNHYGLMPLFLSAAGLEIGFKGNGYNVVFTVKKDNIKLIEDIVLISQSSGNIIGGIKEGTLIAEIDFGLGYYSLKHTSDNRINFSGFIPELINLEIVANIEFTAFNYASETYYTYIAFGKNDYSSFDDFIPSVGSSYPMIPFSMSFEGFDKIKPYEVTSDGEIKSIVVSEANRMDRTFTIPATPSKKYITLSAKAAETFSAVSATSVCVDMIEGILVLSNGTGVVNVYDTNGVIVSDKTLRAGNSYTIVHFNLANKDNFYNSKFNSNGMCETACTYRIYNPQIHVHQSAILIPKYLQPSELLFRSDIPFKLAHEGYLVINKPSNVLKSNITVDPNTALVGQHVIVGEDAYITTYSEGLYKYKKITQ